MTWVLLVAGLACLLGAVQMRGRVLFLGVTGIVLMALGAFWATVSR